MKDDEIKKILHILATDTANLMYQNLMKVDMVFNSDDIEKIKENYIYIFEKLKHD